MKRKAPATPYDEKEKGAERQRARLTSRYGRPPVRSFDPATTAWSFALFTIDSYHDDATNRPVIRIFGPTEAGHSLCVHLHSFLPYFYVPAPPALLKLPKGVERFRERLDEMMYDDDCRRASRKRPNIVPCGIPRVLAVDVVPRESMYGFTLDGKVPFLRITLATPGLFYSCRRILENRPGVVLASGEAFWFPVLYEATMLFILRFMLDRDMRGSCWLTLPAGSYTRAVPRTTSTQLEFHVTNHADMVVHLPEGEWAKQAPRRVVALDIECKSLSGHFPKASEDPVVEIANVLRDEDGKGGKRSRGVIFGLGSHAPVLPPAGLETVDMHAVHDEATLLRCQREFIIDADPDVIEDYNGSLFDHPYVLERAVTLGVPEACQITRVLGEAAQVKKKVVITGAMGTQKNNDILMTGRVHMDMYRIVRRDHKLRSYTLNAASYELLNKMTKDDVHHSDIPRLANGSDADRARLAKYCLKDALLPLLMDDEKSKGGKLTAMSRVTGAPYDILLLRGQMIRGECIIHRHAIPEGFVIPKLPRPPGEEKYKGAIVIDTKKGFYTSPVATLDVNSLYPSIMKALNLCSSTLVLDRAVEAKLKPSDVRVFHIGEHRHVFVRPHIRKGIMCETVRATVDARARTKKALKVAKAAGNKFLEGALDAQQEAEKLTGNSIYGAAGAKTAKMPCEPVAETVTYQGRMILDGMMRGVEKKFTIANGYPCNTECIAGDTDSIMVHMPGLSPDGALKLGQEIVVWINQKHLDEDLADIVIEQEKIYLRSLFFVPKRYTGWTKKPKDPKDVKEPEPFLTIKGLGAVRRDSCLFGSKLLSDSIDMILSTPNVNDAIRNAIAHVQMQFARLLQNKIDMSQLIMSVNLSKELEKYKVKNKASWFAAKLTERDPNAAPRVGDRLQYVVIAGYKGQKVSQRGEDPMWALDNACTLDTRWYLESMRTPLTQVFELVMPNVNELFDGPHTRQVVMPRLFVGNDAKEETTMLRFLHKQAQCQGGGGCRTLLSADQRGLCMTCEPNRGKRVKEVRATLALAKEAADAEWEICHGCAGVEGAQLCRNTDCAHLYRRKTTQTDVQELAEHLTALAVGVQQDDGDVDMKQASTAPQPPATAIPSTAKRWKQMTLGGKIATVRPTKAKPTTPATLSSSSSSSSSLQQRKLEW